MSTESIPVGLRALLVKHCFLAQLTSGKKPCMSDMSLVDGFSWYGKFYRRYWVKESRKTTIADIENIISQTIDAITTHKHKEAFLRLIINALASTRVGLESMVTTYRNDPAMIGRLQVQLTNIDLQLEEHRNLIKGYCNEKIVEGVIQGSGESDKEEFKKFLIGKISTTETVPSGDCTDDNNNNLVDQERMDQERMDQERMDQERIDRDRAERRRRRRNRSKQSTDQESYDKQN